jgi:hypothetical protein
MRNFSTRLLELEAFLQLSYNKDLTTSKLFGGEVGGFIKDIVLNRTDDVGDPFENIEDILTDANQILKEIGYSESTDRNIW